MHIEQTITIKAMPEQIFPFYEDVSNWSSWEPDVQSSSIEGAFKVGAQGRLKPAKGPDAKIVLTEVTNNQSFTTISKLPLCTMRFVHELVPSSDGTVVSHRVIFSGLFAPLFGRLIGAGIKKGLPTTLQGLRDAVESKN